MIFRLHLRVALLALLLVPCCATRSLNAQGQAPSSSSLRISLIDVEGGQSTLFVTPTGQSLLIDTGWPGHEARDAERIVRAAHKAELTHIDYVLLTHYHDDHVGGVPQLVARIPVTTFLDHGPNREPLVEKNYQAYQQVLSTGHYQHIVPKPGDTLPITGIKATVISADGNLIQQPLPGAGQPNTSCVASAPRPADQTENARSLGVLLQFGKLKILDLGDLTWDKEMALMCPLNKLGHVDILIVSHHGWEQSSSPALVNAIAPVVALMDNGETKGGSASTLSIIRAIPNLAALWQLHYSLEGGQQLNTADSFIANPKGTDAGYGIDLTASPDGSFSILNERTNATVSYRGR